MAILPIHIIGSKALKKKTCPIKDFDNDSVSKIINLFDTLKAAMGSGLAANQIGLSDSVLVIDLSYVPEEDEAELELLKEYKKPLVFINPVIEKSWDSCDWEEGCLSIPKLNAMVTRSDKIKIKYRDGKFDEHILETGGYLARVLQHECDHLEGALYTDRLSKLQKMKIRTGLKKIMDGEVNAKYKYTFG
jgi:peptide deformylase